MSSLPWLTPVGDQVAAGTEEEAREIARFRAAHPLLGAAFFRDGEKASCEGDVSLTIANYGGALQVTVRVPSTGQFAFYALTEPEALWSELEAALELRMLRWRSDTPRKKKGS